MFRLANDIIPLIYEKQCCNLQHQITPDEDNRLECRNVGSSCNSIRLCIHLNITRATNVTWLFHLVTVNKLTSYPGSHYYFFQVSYSKYIDYYFNFCLAFLMGSIIESLVVYKFHKVQQNSVARVLEPRISSQSLFLMRTRRVRKTREL